MRDPKTPEQLKREIAFFASVIQRTTSPDRIERAHIAIRRRERELAIALRVRLGRGDRG
jgi:hypothetical protein